MSQQLSTVTTNAEDSETITKLEELVKLFKDAIKLGYSITFTPEQMKALIVICENGWLIKSKSSNAEPRAASSGAE